jgi:hypothetical protein
MKEMILEFTGEDVFVHFDGKLIAKRGHPGTPHAKTWVSLEPGYRVLDGKGAGTPNWEIIIEHDGVRVH